MSNYVCPKCRQKQKNMCPCKKFDKYQCINHDNLFSPGSGERKRCFLFDQKCYHCYKKYDDKTNDDYNPPKLNKLIGLAWVEDPCGIYENQPVVTELCSGQAGQVEEKFNEIMAKLKCVTDPTMYNPVASNLQENQYDKSDMQQTKEATPLEGSEKKNQLNHPSEPVVRILELPEKSSNRRISLLNSSSESDKNFVSFNVGMQRIIAVIIVLFAITLCSILYNIYFETKKCGLFCYRFY